MIKFFYIVPICIFFSAGTLVSQVPLKKEKGNMLISFGMGINYGSTPSYTDYLRNVLSTGTGDTIKTFSAGVEFFGAFEYRFNKRVSAKLDYSYYLRSSHYTFTYYVFDYTIKSHQSYAMIFYNNVDKNFSFKLGGGAGFHFDILDNNVSPSNSLTYTSSGFSFRGEIVFAPKFSEKLETYISGFAYGSTASSLKDENGNILKSTTGKEVNLGGYGIGARLGLSIYLN